MTATETEQIAHILIEFTLPGSTEVIGERFAHSDVLDSFLSANRAADIRRITHVTQGEVGFDYVISEVADKIMTEIRDDMKTPFPWGKQIPRDVASFSELHDYCDANDYLIDAMPMEDVTWDVYVTAGNIVCNLVDRKIKAGELKDNEL